MVRGSKDNVLWLWIYDWYYAFDEHGKMYCDCVTPYRWHVDESGAWVR